ncbi:hypothetical protein [Sphingomonas sp.]|uniref:hypothetical protein n=1 Tax=Sphingomonas sp. TaxID=28214 RepID=UPI001B09CADB|nr:hypothetical protein [Sphingomonas sp.]MBO9712783.1 hypothetical protein [Sphingomonas sp.]
MRVDSSCCNVTICNVSSRGLMLRATQAPPRGAYVELMRPGAVTVARVVWSDGVTFGVQTREKLDVKAMTNPAAAGSSLALQPQRSSAEFAPAARSYVGGLHAGAASEATGHRLQYLAIGFVVLFAAIFGALLAHDLLSGLSRAVTTAMR